VKTAAFITWVHFGNSFGKKGFTVGQVNLNGFESESSWWFYRPAVSRG